MPRITAITTTTPACETSQIEARRFAAAHFSGKLRNLDRLLRVFESAQVSRRFLSRPIDWHSTLDGWSERSRVHVEVAESLGFQLLERLSEQYDLQAQSFDAVILVNSTGIATPSLDARLAARVGFRDDIRRTPLWGLGCAGGAAGLGHAYEYTLARPEHRVLLVNIELCGLTFLADDYSVSNLIATALFGEGASAVVVEGDALSSEGIEILGTFSTLFPDEIDAMGWNVADHGLQVVFERRIPKIVRSRAAKHFEQALGPLGLAIGAVDDWILHPGGPRVLREYEAALGLSAEQTGRSRQTLKNFGNMSSATVMFALEKYAAESRAGVAVLSALGPGFSAETVILGR